ncbi:MAG: thioredoxin [Clostridia bacterium]|nr:thioredoxin [Clostridia bacterium]
MAQQMNTQSFDAALAGDKPVLVDFWATWCGPCKIMAPVIEAVAAKYEGKAIVGKVDVDENPDLAQRYGIMSIPTLMLFKGGEKVNMSVGVTPAANVEAMLDAVI